MQTPREMTAEELLLYADQLAAAILQPAVHGVLSHADVMKAATIAFQILKAVYPSPERLFEVLQEAEGTLELVVLPSGENVWN